MLDEEKNEEQMRHEVRVAVSDVDITVSFTMLVGLTVVAFAYAMHLLSTGTRLRT